MARLPRRNDIRLTMGHGGHGEKRSSEFQPGHFKFQSGIAARDADALQVLSDKTRCCEPCPPGQLQVHCARQAVLRLSRLAHPASCLFHLPS